MRLAGVRGDGSDEAFVHMLSAKMHAESKTRRANKTLSRYKQAASASSAGTARGFMADALGALSSVAVVGTGRRGHAVVKEDRPCERVALETEDVAFLKKVSEAAKKNPSGTTLPLFEYNSLDLIPTSMSNTPFSST